MSNAVVQRTAKDNQHCCVLLWILYRSELCLVSPWTLLCLILRPSGSLLVCTNFCDFSREIFFLLFFPISSEVKKKRKSFCLGTPLGLSLKSWTPELYNHTHQMRESSQRPGNWKQLFQNNPPGSWSPGMDVVNPSVTSVELVTRAVYYCVVFGRR